MVKNSITILIMSSRIPLNVFRYEVLPFIGDLKTLIVITLLDKKHNDLINYFGVEVLANMAETI